MTARNVRRRLLMLVIMGAFLAPILLLFRASRNAVAMPMFSRKLGVACSTCHTVIPRLNKTGFKFRAAGFRMPETIGDPDDKKFDLGDYFSARIQARYDTVNQAFNSKVPKTRTAVNSFSFAEVTIYPVTGAWGKYLSSMVEMSFAPEDFGEVENAYVRFTKGNENAFFSARAGIFHPIEGYGGSDRPYSNSRPLFQRTFAKNGAIPTVFLPWGLDQAGVEVGGDYKNLSARFTIFNGTFIRFVDEAHTFLPFAAQTGPWKGPTGVPGGLSKPGTFPGTMFRPHNTPDFQFFTNYILTEDGGGLSFYYYRGNVATPSTVSNPPGASDLETPGYYNNFDRVAVYGSFPILSRALAQGGFEVGRDTLPSGARFKSKGVFVEGAFEINEYATAGLRYDWFRPSTAITRNEQWAVTPFVNIPFNNGFQLISEYQRRNFKQGILPDKQDDLFQIRVIFIK